MKKTIVTIVSYNGYCILITQLLKLNKFRNNGLGLKNHKN